MKRILFGVALALTLVVGSAGVASAQWNFGSYTKTETGAVGGVIVGYQASADTTILAGELVCLDSTSTVKRVAVRKYLPGTTHRLLFVGIAIDRIPAGTANSGRILTWGYHPAAYVGAQGLAVNNQLKLSLTVPGSFSLADTMSSAQAIIRGGVSGALATRYRYKVWLLPGPRIAGATL